MSHTPISGVHNPSPYLRRYRLPTINSNETVSAYDELLSPIDNCAKLAFISALNFQNKQFRISKPTIPLNNTVSSADSTELSNGRGNSTRNSAISYIDTSMPTERPTERGNSLNKTTSDFEFRFVARELEKKCYEYDRIADIAIDKTTNETNKSDKKIL